MAKKVKKTKVAASKGHSSLAGEHSFLIIVGGGFIVILLILMILGRSSVAKRYAMMKQEAASMTKEVADDNTVTISDDMVTPDSLTVPVGTQVTWINAGTADHKVTSYNGTFDSVNLENGEKSTYMFTTAGTYTYTVGEMTGSVIVE